MTAGKDHSLPDCVEAIESGYEFMLAYAAQGRDSEDPSASPDIRTILEQMQAAIDALPQAIDDRLTSGTGPPGGAFRRLRDVIDGDTKKASAMIAAVLAVPSISSQLVDNLNAAVHVRTLLTDLFLIDEALAAMRREMS